MNYNNQNFVNNSKYIKIKGLAGLDSIISVYNEEGFKVAALFDNQKNLVCEVSLPIKYLKPLIGNGNKIGYHVLLDGLKGVTATVTSKANGDPEKAALIENISARFNAYSNIIAAPTDFSGEYILAKKP